MKAVVLSSLLRFAVVVGAALALGVGLLWLAEGGTSVEQPLESQSVLIQQILTAGSRSAVLILMAVMVTAIIAGSSFLAEARFPTVARVANRFMSLFSAMPTIFLSYFALIVFSSSTSLLLAAVCLAIGDGFYNETKAHADEALESIRGENYVAYGTAMGYSLWHSASRDLAVRMTTLLGSRIVPLVSSAVIVERVFLATSPWGAGLGNMAVQSADSSQLVKLGSIVLLLVAIVAAQNLIIRLAAGFLDPRRQRNPI